MKKIGITIIAILAILSLTMLGVGCTGTSEEAAEAGEAAEETAEEAAEETAEEAGESEVVADDELYIIHIPKVVHPWFDIVQIGAEAMAASLTENTNTKVTVEYIAPAQAEVTEQNAIIQQAATKGADGIFIDPLDASGNAQVFQEIREQGLLVTVYDCTPFDDYTSVASTAEDMAEYEMTRLMGLINEEGKVAVMQGFPTAPSHKQRYDYIMKYGPERYPNVEFVDGGIDNDDMETARQQAAATIAANPDLVGYLGCDAAFPVGVAQAIKEAGKVGEIQVVGLGEMTSILDYVKEGVLESTVYIAPDMQGAYSVLLHYVNSLGFYTQGDQIPNLISIGCAYIDQSNVDEYMDKFNVPVEAETLE